VSEPADNEGVTVEVRRGEPTPDELAALVAVVSEAYAGEAAAALADDPGRRSGWELSQRGLRAPIDRELGWGRFGA
jgi:hypothetical protein